MKIKFKHQAFQKAAVASVVDCFIGQPFQEGFNYRINPGKNATGIEQTDFLDCGFRNANIKPPPNR